MAEKTPQTEALTKKLLESDKNIASFKDNPDPHLEEHRVSLTSDERENLKNHLAAHDVSTLRMTLTQSGAHAMFSQKA